MFQSVMKMEFGDSMCTYDINSRTDIRSPRRVTLQPSHFSALAGMGGRDRMLAAHGVGAGGLGHPLALPRRPHYGPLPEPHCAALA